MGWILCFISSLTLLTVSAVMTVTALQNKTKKTRALGAFNYLAIGVALGAVIIFLPVFYQSFKGDGFAYIKTLLLSIHAAFQMFSLDADFDVVVASMQDVEGWIRSAYLLYVSVIFVTAPVLTFGFILSLFKNITAYLKMLLSRSADIYVFSELNRKSLILAGDLRKNHKNATIIFADFYKNSGENSEEMGEEARALNAICIKKDITSIDLGLKKNKRRVSFFISGEEDIENINQSLKLIKDYGNRENTNLYIFSSSVESALVVESVKGSAMKIRRVDEIRALIEYQLYTNGARLFETAAKIEGSDNKLISAVVVGMGRYGTEMIKSLLWFCQMDGYELQLDVFDKQEDAQDRLAALCPEVLSDKYNGVHVDGEAYYKINVHSNIDASTATFANAISRIHATYVLVALGSDEENIKTAINMRMIFERNGIKPAIQAIVHNGKLKNVLSDVTNFRGQSYGIEYIGDNDTMYCDDVLINSALEADALKRHLLWGKEEDFWAYEYNYRSSVASAIHLKARIACGIDGADKSEGELTETEIKNIESIEHRRWNAYMRSQGYIYSGSVDKESRNDLAKMHNNLVDFDTLTEDQKRLDLVVKSK